MYKLWFALVIVFSILTVAGAVYVMMHRGALSAGYACIPCVLTTAFLALYRKDRPENRSKK